MGTLNSPKKRLGIVTFQILFRTVTHPLTDSDPVMMTFSPGAAR
jgi:hypothetical protein